MNLKNHILYVDHEQDNLIAFKTVFRRFFNVTIANGGDEAIKNLEKQKFDVLLTDQRMPGMTGVELCEYVMNHYPTARRIIVTGYHEKKVLEDALENGRVERLVMKPWNANELRAEIESVIV